MCVVAHTALPRSHSSYAVSLAGENARLAELVRGVDLDAPVPTCPGWTVRKLLTHVGRGDRWAATIVRTHESVDLRTVADGRPPVDPEGLDRWLRATPQILVDAVAATGPDVPVWTFIGPKPAAWWIRRRLHESTVHGADLALALDVPVELDPALAADGISEYFDLIAARPEPVLPEGTSVHLHATDGLDAGEWTLFGLPEGNRWEAGHRKGDTAVRGSAVDLLLAVYRRIPVDERVAVFGDRGLLDVFFERTPF